MRYVVMAMLVSLTATVGCRTTRNTTLAQTEVQAREAAITSAVLKEAIKSGTDHIAERLSSMPESGAVGYARTVRAIRDKEGNLVLNKATGEAQVEETEALGKSNSMRELSGGFAEGRFGLASVSADGSEILEGLVLEIRSLEGGTTLNERFAAVWADASVEEKQAAADAVAKSLEQRRGMMVDVITAGGTAAKGILHEVYKATPWGAGMAAVDVLIAREGQKERATVVEPMKKPAE